MYYKYRSSDLQLYYLLILPPAQREQPFCCYMCDETLVSSTDFKVHYFRFTLVDYSFGQDTLEELIVAIHCKCDSIPKAALLIVYF